MSETNRVLKCDLHLKPNIKREGAKALKELQQDKDRAILTENKGMAMVVCDKQDYINKEPGPFGTKGHL